MMPFVTVFDYGRRQTHLEFAIERISLSDQRSRSYSERASYGTTPKEASRKETRPWITCTTLWKG